jgi:hypothetical protein
MLSTAKRLVRQWQENLALTTAAKDEVRRDRNTTRPTPPAIDTAIHAAMVWLKRAQDLSASRDGGVARDFSLLSGWATSYPETTGYIVPTMLVYADLYHDPDARNRARRMLDWLVSIQFAEGGFQGGRIDAPNKVPVTFNTGQILLGLAAGVAEFGEAYRAPLRKAGDWLRDSLDADGCWRRHATPFAAPGDKTYETHVAWGLFEADRVEPGRGYGEAGLKQVGWALTQQQRNGWLANCCLTNRDQPLTHTLGYALRGFMEAHRFSQDPEILARARHTADGLLSVLDEHGFLPGCIDSQWAPRAEWSCLTGEVQIAECWLMLFECTGERRYFEAATRANAYVRSTMRLANCSDDVHGAIKGSFPVQGAYGAYQYLNWAAKFFIDSHLRELRLRASSALHA